MSCSKLFSFTHWVPLLFPSSQPLLLPIPVQSYIHAAEWDPAPALPSKICSCFWLKDLRSFLGTSFHLFGKKNPRDKDFKTLNSSFNTVHIKRGVQIFLRESLRCIHSYRISIDWKISWTAPDDQRRLETKPCNAVSLLSIVYWWSRCWQSDPGGNKTWCRSRRWKKTLCPLTSCYELCATDVTNGRVSTLENCWITIYDNTTKHSGS